MLATPTAALCLGLVLLLCGTPPSAAVETASPPALIADNRSSIAPDDAGDDALIAAQLYFESLNLLASNTRSTAPCFDLMSEDIGKVVDKFCRQDAKGQREKTCITFFGLATDLGRLKLEREAE